MTDQVASSLDTSWVLQNAVMVLTMQAGSTFLQVGLTRTKFVGITILKNMTCMAVMVITFGIAGYAFAFGSGSSTGATTFVGLRYFGLDGVPSSMYGHAFFHMALAVTAMTIVAAGCCERIFCKPYLIYAAVFGTIIYPPVAHAVWSAEGFLSASNPSPALPVGAMDFAGAGVVHLCAGVAALTSCLICGPRDGFLDENGHAKRTTTTSYANAGIGCILLWIGFFAFNCGSTNGISTPTQEDQAGRIALTTSGASAGAVLASVCIDQVRSGQMDIMKCMRSCLAALVAIASSCHSVEPWASCLIGAGAGVVADALDSALLRFKVDDPIGIVPVHLGGGLWGLLAAGIFAHRYGTGVIYGDGRLLLSQVVAILFETAWAGALSFATFRLIDRYLGLNESVAKGVETFGELDVEQARMLNVDHAMLANQGVRMMVTDPKQAALLSRFVQHCRKEYCDEQVAFLIEAQRDLAYARSVAPDDLPARTPDLLARKAALFREFIRKGGTRQININAKLHDVIQERLGDPEFDTIAMAMEEIFAMLQNGPFARFWVLEQARIHQRRMARRGARKVAPGGAGADSDSTDAGAGRATTPSNRKRGSAYNVSGQREPTASSTDQQPEP
ncbi:RGS domain-containing protein [Plasmodiophora brassicae]